MTCNYVERLLSKTLSNVHLEAEKEGSAGTVYGCKVRSNMIGRIA